jgi:hypothetical protein
VDDISFIGFKCHCKGIGAYKTRDWIYITAKARVEYAPEYEGKGVVLEGISVEAARPSKEEIVYFT